MLLHPHLHLHVHVHLHLNVYFCLFSSKGLPHADVVPHAKRALYTRRWVMETFGYY
jgi:hypothetical protein